MPKAGNINVEVQAKITVSDETAERCLRLLEIWQEDNPDKNIVVDCDAMNDGSNRVRMSIEPFYCTPVDEDDHPG